MQYRYSDEFRSVKGIDKTELTGLNLKIYLRLFFNLIFLRRVIPYKGSFLNFSLGSLVTGVRFIDIIFLETFRRNQEKYNESLEKMIFIRKPIWVLISVN